ncbi:hypothetical protein L3X38_034912 [Prunus dulcis]|uniref:RNase H type-1 domain-containing protein n=1 Tax=Prunus dulcis TaxID=3755 RepID=A0AAD4YZ04_PRUDU|nr:hypothetical protein L3X38_034912 [Prunus dulcis]
MEGQREGGSVGVRCWVEAAEQCQALPSQRSPRPQNLGHHTAWSPPLNPLVKLNADVAWDPISKSMGIGVVVKDHIGQFLAGKSLLAQADLALMAECLACLERCRFASEMGDQLVSFESDCLEAVKTINGDISREKWEIYPILSNIRDFLLALRSCSWTWIPHVLSPTNSLEIGIGISQLLPTLGALFAMGAEVMRRREAGMSSASPRNVFRSTAASPKIQRPADSPVSVLLFGLVFGLLFLCSVSLLMWLFFNP